MFNTNSGDEGCGLVACILLHGHNSNLEILLWIKLNESEGAISIGILTFPLLAYMCFYNGENVPAKVKIVIKTKIRFYGNLK